MSNPTSYRYLGEISKTRIRSFLFLVNYNKIGRMPFNVTMSNAAKFVYFAFILPLGYENQVD